MRTVRGNNTPMSLLRSDRYENAEGWATLESDGSGIVFFKTFGRYTLELATQATETMTSLVGVMPNLQVFADFSQMESYDPASRVHATSWCREHLMALSSVHILSRAGLVGMGVSTAAMTLNLLGLKMKAYRDAKAFMEAHHDARQALNTGSD